MYYVCHFIHPFRETSVDYHCISKLCHYINLFFSLCYCHNSLSHSSIHPFYTLVTSLIHLLIHLLLFFLSFHPLMLNYLFIIKWASVSKDLCFSITHLVFFLEKWEQYPGIAWICPLSCFPLYQTDGETGSFESNLQFLLHQLYQIKYSWCA